MKANKISSLFTLSCVLISTVGCSQETVNNISLDNNSVQSQSVKKSRGNSGDIIPGEYIIKLKENSKNSVSIFSSSGAEKIRDIGTTGMQLIRIDGGSNHTNSLNSINSQVEWIEPNRVIALDYQDPKPFEIATTGPVASYPNDPMFAQQYSHKLVRTQEAWQVTHGSPDVIVAIVDTGVDGTHPDLKNKIVPGFDVYNPKKPESAYKDPQGHGTHCAGIAAASGNNGIGVSGFAPEVKIQAVRVLDDNGSGSYESVAQGITWAATHGAKVLSMSLGGPSSSKAIEEACKLAIKNDILVVAATGNDGTSKLSYPAAIKGVMAVGATDAKDKRASFSQYGTNISVTAPGVDILSTFPQYDNGIGLKNYGSISGTSMATPAVAGLAALIRSKFPNLKATAVRSRIEKTADDLGDKGFDKYYGYGRINAAKAFN